MHSARPVFGLVNRIADASVVEVIGGNGFDHVMIDCEHAPFTWPDVQARVLAAQNAGMSAYVRVPSALPHEIGLALDLGADGVHVPHVRSRDDAEAACDAAYYEPRGRRGFALSHRGARYGRLTADQLIRQHNEARVIAHIEDVAAVDAIEEIAACDRIGVLFVAPFDLSYGLGVAGDLQAPALWDALERVAGTARTHGRACGTYVNDYSRVPALEEMGYSYFLLGGDLGMLAGSLASARRSVEEHRRVQA